MYLPASGIHCGGWTRISLWIDVNNPTSPFFFLFFREEVQHIKLPKDIEDAKALGRVLSRYNEKYFITVTAGFFTTYILYPLMKKKKGMGLILSSTQRIKVECFGKFWSEVGCWASTMIYSAFALDEIVGKLVCCRDWWRVCILHMTTIRTTSPDLKKINLPTISIHFKKDANENHV